ncbi:MAG: molybdenum cofactor guanylyltransferase [Proteobacteria bacterium]|nr:molybdenum cofactor guanylyltransferase [Pseudomonadota bacterium]
MIDKVACVVLVGGESRRMGEDKASVDLAGKALVERVLDVVRPLFNHLYIGAHTDSKLGDAYGLPTVIDTLPGRGPALGVCAALERAEEERVFVISCDLPSLNARVVEYLIEQADGFDVVAARIDGRVQTTCAIYSRACLAPLEERISTKEKGARSLNRFLEETEGLKVRYVDEQELKNIEGGIESFVDVDTPEELRVAKQKILGEMNR